MYKAGDVVVNRRGDVVRLIHDKMMGLAFTQQNGTYRIEKDGTCLSEHDFDIVGYAKMTPKDNPINPNHYARLSPEPWDVNHAWKMCYDKGTAISYIARSGFKNDEIEDLEKAIAHLQHKVKKLKEEKGGD